MVKALINDDHDGQIHLLMEHFSKYTLCGKKLHPISTTYTPELGVTCDECLGVHAKVAEMELLISADKVTIHYRCCECKDIIDMPLTEHLNTASICGECTHMENFMEITGISIEKD